MLRFLLLLSCFLLLPVASADEPDFEVELQAGPAWQSRNDVQIPTASGTRLALTDFGRGPFFAMRGYATVSLSHRHQLRVLVAPFTARADGTFPSTVQFNGVAFAANTATAASYRFNSYRLTYRYRILDEEAWQGFLGFTAKVREAHISLAQAGANSISDNVGFVPLIHFSVSYAFAPRWLLLLDADAIIAPQGRAEDVFIGVRYEAIERGHVTAGYRFVEGGAENSKVYTFAFLHYAVLGVVWSADIF